MDRANSQSGALFRNSVVNNIEAVIGLAERYRQLAAKNGDKELADILERVPKHGARTFREALQFFRILHFSLWCEGEYHNTIGRFDQYMYPYLKNDLETGFLTEETAYDLLLEFFISFNKDSDLYPGVQQGDNGQSMVLGGVDEHGRPAFNMLTYMCHEASRELKLIDPKINLRVDRRTPPEVYYKGTELTKVGLGFPQYSNDDIIIPGLLNKGYSLKDARNYSLAACWETIIPGCGMDIPNIGAVSFPGVVDECIHEELTSAKNFDDFFEKVKIRISEVCFTEAEKLKNLWMIPAPFMSVLMDGCLDRGKDISLGARYNNYGFHGTGVSTAADSLAAIKKFVFDEEKIDASALIKAVDSNFDDSQSLVWELRNEAPKMGNDDNEADTIATELLDAFADALEGLENERGGVFRAGTGSAMYYLWHSRQIGASPDGRRRGEALGANYSPSLFAKLNGPISIVKSFTKPDLTRVINGGPLTMEFHDSLFKDEESIKKVGMLVKSFIDMGGNQFQLNAVNKDTLIDAQKHPENYRNLIVRIWGWSAYFVELDKEYQDHVIMRQEHVM